MRQEDVPEVSRVERLCFTNPWPQSAYRRELRKPSSNYYVVLRERRDSAQPSEQTEDADDRPWHARILPFPRREEREMDSDPIIGFAGMWIVFDEAHVTTIGVHPGYRGHGLGELILAHLFVAAIKRGAEMVTLEVRVSNESAQSLYRKYGFTNQGLRRHYYSDNGEDAYIMWSPSVREPEWVKTFQRLRRELVERLGETLEPGTIESLR